MLSVFAVMALVNVSLLLGVLVNGALSPVEAEVTLGCTEMLDEVTIIVVTEVVVVGVLVKPKFILPVCATEKETVSKQQARVAKMVSMITTSCSGKKNERTC